MEIAHLYGDAPLIAANATETALRQQICKADVVHLATHGYLDPLRPMSSGVLLTIPAQEPPAGQTENDGILAGVGDLQPVGAAGGVGGALRVRERTRGECGRRRHRRVDAGAAVFRRALHRREPVEGGGREHPHADGGASSQAAAGTGEG